MESEVTLEQTVETLYRERDGLRLRIDELEREVVQFKELARRLEGERNLARDTLKACAEEGSRLRERLNGGGR